MDRPTNPEDELTSFLRQGAGREMAEEAAEDEAQTEQLRQRRLDLASVVEDAAHRGERATADMGQTSVISGPILATGTDYLTIRLPDQEADIRFDAALWSFVPGQGGTSSTRSGMSFLGLLKEHSGGGKRVRIELEGGNHLMGVIKTVGQDHLRVEDPDGRLAYVPLAGVRAIIRSTSQH